MQGVEKDKRSYNTLENGDFCCMQKFHSPFHCSSPYSGLVIRLEALLFGSKLNVSSLNF